MLITRMQFGKKETPGETRWPNQHATHDPRSSAHSPNSSSVVSTAIPAAEGCKTAPIHLQPPVSVLSNPRRQSVPIWFAEVGQLVPPFQMEKPEVCISAAHYAACCVRSVSRPLPTYFRKHFINTVHRRVSLIGAWRYNSSGFIAVLLRPPRFPKRGAGKRWLSGQ
jgi:hypothetical protein